MNHQKQFVPALSFTTACRRYRVKQAWAERSSVAAAAAAAAAAQRPRIQFLKVASAKKANYPINR